MLGTARRTERGNTNNVEIAEKEHNMHPLMIKLMKSLEPPSFKLSSLYL